jgi:multidrug efflux pump subunit AcrA (membrane-fusion protein)
LQQPLETGATRWIARVRIGLLVLIGGAGIGAALMPLFESAPRVSSAPKSYAPGAEGPRGSATEEARVGVFSQTLAAPATIEEDGSITAALYRDEYAALLAGYDATRFMTLGATPKSFAVEPSAQPSAWDESSLRVRFVFVSDQSSISSRPLAGTLGTITAWLRPHEALMVPDEAVLHGKDGPHVMVALPDGQGFEQRAIEIGRSQKGMTFVTSGLAPGERVATGLACFVDAEHRMRAEATEHTAVP